MQDFIIECNLNLNDNSKESKIALDYLKGRNLNEKSISIHKIGYCKKNQQLHESIKNFGNDPEKNYSYFINGRIIVPIYEEFGKVVAFATRKPSFEPGNTWWNLPSPFEKRNHFFLIDKCRKSCFKHNKIYIVEGYMDALILNQYGMDNVVALMGTALTSRKIGLIARYCENVCFCLDMDVNESGQKATDKSIAILNEFGFCESISIINEMPLGEDPASYIPKVGLETFLSYERKLSDKEIREINIRVRKKRQDNRKDNKSFDPGKQKKIPVIKTKFI